VLFSLAYRPHVIVERASSLEDAEVIDVVLTQAPEQEQAPVGDVSVFGGAEVHAVSASDIQGEVLHDVSLVVEPGSIVSVQSDDDRARAVLCGLLLGHNEADKGFVALSGARIEALSKESLRKTVVPVTRKTPLFTGTVRQNLRIGRPSASDAELVDACREAGLAAFLSEGDVLGLEVDDPSVSSRLTAEVRQRIGLARAILSGAPLIVMNDPTGDLGPLEEARYLRNVERLAPSRAVLIVTRTDLAERIARTSFKMEDGSLRAASIEQAIPDPLAAPSPTEPSPTMPDLLSSGSTVPDTLSPGSTAPGIAPGATTNDSGVIL
jgi:ABC-type transport system involved in cytochrome bd biosynthesis fused ATPase/permease subunit